MRFDDMLATLLAQPAPTAEARAIMWRQVVDVLAQGRGHHVDDPLVDAPRAMDAYNFLRSIRPEIPVTVRQSAGRALVGRRVPPELILLFAEDLPHIAAPALGGVLLYEDQWLALLPRLSPSARNLMRNRRDLGETIAKALEHFGSTDFLISGPTSTQEAVAPLVAGVEPLCAAPVEPEPQPEPVMPPPEQEDLLAEAPSLVPIQSETQIRDLLSRIETFRARHLPNAGSDRATEAPSFEPDLSYRDEADHPVVESFRFETGIDGVICRVQGAPAEPLTGETIAVAARQTDHGVDGHAAGAYRSRTPFRDARLTIAGDGPVSGEWRISAVPFFDSRDHRFGGYRGSARRPRADETAKAVSAPPPRAAEHAPNDSLHKLVKELRTPLAAIIDFSEAIDGQPTVAPYRSRAQEILEQSRKLLNAVEDLDLVAIARSDDAPDDGASVDAAAILMRLHGDFEDAARERASDLAFRIDPELPLVAADSATVERMLSRMLAATIAMSSEGERICIDLQRDPRRSERLLMTVVRPRALAGRDEKMLLDPGYNPGGNWPDAPVLGLGFALRLIRNLALACGGMLEIDSTRFYLSLPLRDGTAQALNGNR
ncbi:sensor histidine kinase [Sphingomonas sp. YR710]|uniref:sensor histidine kinase n=1 Tax=Sphingomonas sp. YR710 TaxID=1882773 RepID=UPI00210D81C0|nr:sensor histidine kinase [Sphingomonas sp. YR710]